MMPKINFNMVKAIVRRDLKLYFSNPTGYVFITLFIFLSAAAAFWQDRFFLNNLANLNQLNAIFPLLLVLFIPALTMGCWSDERRQGTDELLLTLPATDLEVVLGKYLSILGIYSAALLLSFSHVLVLFWLGSPDLGLMFGNYLGYWLLGAALIPVGMLASLLTANATIAFILGALFCAFFAFIDGAGGLISETLGNWLAPLGLVDHFGDYARGIISFSGLLYFVSLAGLFLYLNEMFISRRHWPLKADGFNMSIHHLIRVVALVIALISANAIIGRLALRLDVTAEKLHSLSDETAGLLNALPDDRAVFIQAYLSEEVPQQYVQVRENLVGYLKEIDAVGGSKVEVLIHDTEPYTTEARDAREKFGINPVEVPDPANPRGGAVPTFMGIAFTSGAQEVVIPFLEPGLSAEYELLRSIRVAARAERKKVGLLVTEAKLFGGFDFQAGSTAAPWPVVEELEKQYEVVRITAASPITESLDGLIVPMPSTMPQEQMDNLLTFIETGVPTLLLIDPLPVVNLGIAPSEKAGSNRNPFMQNSGPPPAEKGNINAFMNRLGISWNIQQIVWDGYNPHPDLASLPPEIVFVGRGNRNQMAFNPENSATQPLEELVLLFPGYIGKAPGSSIEFTPLVQSGTQSGIQQYSNMVRRSFFGSQLVTRGLPRFPSAVEYTMAARIKSNMADSSSTAKLDMTVIADIDFISEQFFQIRRQGIPGLNFDNVTFFLNSLDQLVQDESFVALRSRRVKHRTLESVENRIQEFIAQRTVEEQQAESEAQVALTDAQRRLDQKVGEVEQRQDMDAQAKQILSRQIQEVEQRRFTALKNNIEAEKEAKVADSKERMESSIRAIQNGIKTFAVLLPPIPVFIMGVMIFFRRRRREAEGAISARRLRS